MNAIRSEDVLQGGREDPLRIVRSRGFLARLSPGLVDELTDSAQLIHYPAGSVSAPVRDAAWAAVVVSGVFRHYLSMRDGRQVTIRYARAGDLIGWPDTDDAWLRPEIEALERSDLLHFDLARIERTARREPELSAALTAELANRLIHAYRIVASTAFATVRSRVARDLLERTRTGMGWTEPPRPGTHLRVTQQALADATGSVREVVARALRELRMKGVIETDQSGITIRKVDALIAEAGQSP